MLLLKIGKLLLLVLQHSATPTATSHANVPVAHEHDLFYDVLCQRVKQTLQQSNIDPIRDRVPNTLRYVYYIFLIVATVFSCVRHIVKYVCYILDKTTQNIFVVGIGNNNINFSFPWITITTFMLEIILPHMISLFIFALFETYSYVLR